LLTEILGAERSRRALGDQAVGLAGDDAPEQVLAVRVDEVEQQQQHADEQQVAVPAHELEPAATVERAGVARGGADRHGRPVPPATDPERDEGVEQQHGRRQEHERVHAQRSEQHVRHHPTQDGADRLPEAHDAEQPLALLVRVDVVRERPELGDHHEVEDAHPEEERDMQAGGPRRREHDEDDQVRDEEQRHAEHEALAVHPTREPRVGGHQEQQQQRLARRDVTLQFRPALGEDERLAHDLDDVVGQEQQEHAQREQQDVRTLPGAHVPERQQQPVEPAASCRDAGRRRIRGLDSAHGVPPATGTGDAGAQRATMRSRRSRSTRSR